MVCSVWKLDSLELLVLACLHRELVVLGLFWVLFFGGLFFCIFFFSGKVGDFVNFKRAWMFAVFTHTLNEEAKEVL